METSKRGFRGSPALWVAVVFILAGAFLLAAKAAAHEFPNPQSWDTSVTPKTSNGTAALATFLSSAASDYTNNTDLDVDYCNEPCTENISNIMINNGDDGYAAWAFWTGNPAYEGRIEWNSYYAGGWSSRTKHLLARHELGHIFGLDHVPETGPASVMGRARDHMHVLHTHDKDDINVKY